MTTDTHTEMSAETRKRAHAIYWESRKGVYWYTPKASKAWAKAKAKAVREAHGEYFGSEWIAEAFH